MVCIQILVNEHHKMVNIKKHLLSTLESRCFLWRLTLWGISKGAVNDDSTEVVIPFYRKIKDFPNITELDKIVAVDIVGRGGVAVPSIT